MIRPRILLLSLLTLSLVLPAPFAHLHRGHGTEGWLSSAFAAEQKYTCGMHPMIVVDEPGLCPICGMDLVPLEPAGGGKSAGERKIRYWVAPMDPTYIRDEPGKSPMGMDLVPVYEDEATGGVIVTIDPVTVQNMGVRTVRAEKRTLQRTVRTVGNVVPMEPRQFSVNSKVNGWVETLHVNETGQRVQRGQKLLEIYSPELVTAQQEYLLALANFEAVRQSPFADIVDGARRLLEASRSRLAYWDITDGQIAALEESRQPRRTLTLHAGHRGIVMLKNVESGMFVKGGVELFKIADIGKVWVMADIYEYELPWVKAGQPAEIVLPFVGGKTVRGVVSFIYPFVEPKTRTVKARIELDNPEYELKPDMYVNVRIHSDPVREALAVPVEAVLRSGEKETVFVALDGGRFEPRLVRTGVQNQEGYVQVLQGLMPGEAVVTSAQFMLDSESKLKAAVQKMMQPQQAPAAPAGAGSKGDLDDLFEDKPAGKKENLDDLFR